jgi:hypothetical protein
VKNQLTGLFAIMTLNKQKLFLIQEELERRVLHGLSCEWDEAVFKLGPSFRGKLRKPLFSLSDMSGKWGYWSNSRNEICLGRTLVLNHSWDAVKDVLLHEIAHQFADQVLGIDNEPPHGPGFKKACYLLRADPKASGKYILLDNKVFDDSANREDRIMVRIKKLMALAQSSNQNEAEAAMTKAHEFIRRYNIDLLERDENRDFVSVFIGKPALRHFREHYDLSHLLQEFYFVYGIWTPAYVLDKGKMGRVLEISGTVQNVKIASYVHDFVRSFIESQWDKYNMGRRLSRYRKTDFAMGIIRGFHSKLKTRDNKVNDKLALVMVEDPLLKKYTAHRYPRVTILTGKAIRRDKNILKDGMDIGKELIISKGISNKGGGKGLLTQGLQLTSHGERDKS